jgi:nucleoside diphosphate kinase
MEENTLTLLRLFKQYIDNNDVETISSPIIARITMQNMPDLVYSGKIREIIKEFEKAGLMELKTRGYKLTDLALKTIGS